MNIDFEKNNYEFNARVSAIIYNKEKTKVLLFKVEDGRDYFLLPGGRIELNEDSKSAIEREIKEELNFELNYELCSVQENFVSKENKKIMQYCFCYKGIYNGKIEKNIIKCLDNDGQSFYWIDLDKINEYIIYPLSSKDLIINNNGMIQHIVEKM